MRIVTPTDEQIQVSLAAAQRGISDPRATEGMTLLDHHAGVALGGILSNPMGFALIVSNCVHAGIEPEDHVAKLSHDYAEAMLRERARRIA